MLIHCLEDDNLLFLKADVQPSQRKTHHRSAWILVSSVGKVETAGCSCVGFLFIITLSMNDMFDVS